MLWNKKRKKISVLLQVFVTGLKEKYFSSFTRQRCRYSGFLQKMVWLYYNYTMQSSVIVRANILMSKTFTRALYFLPLMVTLIIRGWLTKISGSKIRNHLYKTEYWKGELQQFFFFSVFQYQIYQETSTWRVCIVGSFLRRYFFCLKSLAIVLFALKIYCPLHSGVYLKLWYLYLGVPLGLFTPFLFVFTTTEGCIYLIWYVKTMLFYFRPKEHKTN